MTDFDVPVPEGSVVTGVVIIAGYLMPDGCDKPYGFTCKVEGDMTAPEVIGLMEVAKRDYINGQFAAPLSPPA